MALSTRNVQCVVPAEVHRVLREVAYSKHTALRDLICEVLCKFVEDYQNKRTLSVP